MNTNIKYFRIAISSKVRPFWRFSQKKVTRLHLSFRLMCGSWGFWLAEKSFIGVFSETPVRFLPHSLTTWSTGDPRYEYAPVAQRLLRPEARSPWQPRQRRRRHQRRRPASSWSCCCRRRRHNPRPPQHRQHIWRCCCCCWYWRETSCERRGQPQRRRHRRPEHRRTNFRCD